MCMLHCSPHLACNWQPRRLVMQVMSKITMTSLRRSTCCTPQIKELSARFECIERESCEKSDDILFLQQKVRLLEQSLKYENNDTNWPRSHGRGRWRRLQNIRGGARGVLADGPRCRSAQSWLLGGDLECTSDMQLLALTDAACDP